MRNFMRTPADRRASRNTSRVETVPAPIRGWVEDEGLANPEPGAAERLENWFPTTNGVRVRGGTLKFATITTSDGVVSMFNYNTAAVTKLFAASASAVYDITSPADPDVSPTAEFTGQTSGYYGVAQLETAGGDFMYIANGDDSLRLFDGTSWSTITGVSAPVAITGVTTSDLDAPWVYRNRLFFIEANTMVAWYLPVDSVGGAALDFTLAGVFQKGGYLLFGATWSLDAGDGIDDKCVFVSSEGEVAVYEGSDPSDAATWNLVGRYEIGHPLGKKAHFRAGGNLMLITAEGVVPITEVIIKDRSALSHAAISRQIEATWTREATARADQPWEAQKWPDKNMTIFSVPTSIAGQDKMSFVVNSITGAWCKYTGWSAQSLAYHGDQVFYGDDNGEIFKIELGGQDDGLPYSATAVIAFQTYRPPQAFKTANMIRATFKAGSPFVPQLSISSDYTVELPSPPNAAAASGTALWDTAVWDTDKWDGGAITQIQTGWQSAPATGFAFAPQIQTTAGDILLPDVELISIDILYEAGDVVV